MQNDPTPSVLFIPPAPPQDKSGTSVHLRSIAQFLRAEGIRTYLLVPSLRSFGRKPAGRIALDRRLYETVEVRGGVHIGDWWFRFSLAAYRRAGREAARRALRRLSGGRVFAVPGQSYWDTGMATAAEKAAVNAAIRRLRPTAIIVSYYYFADLMDVPEAAATLRFMIVHNVVFERRESFRRAGLPMPESAVSREEELRCYAKADALLSVQMAEADMLRAALPGKRVILMPMGFPLPPLQPGSQEPATCLFVGSGNPVNQEGLRWFCDRVWGLVRGKRPDARLDVCGGVCNGFGAVPDGVVLRGLVDDLGAFYARATVCTVPLLAGSGLKIKMVEAMAHGCAIVTTSVGAQGLESFTDRGFLLRDDPAETAAAILDLFASAERRAALQRGARAVASETFSEEACYGGLRDAIREAAAARPA